MISWIIGSSPLARGLPRRREDVHHRPGIIPARAGFTTIDSFMARVLQDHPRSRGVYAPFSLYCASPPGSSPLARGLRGHVVTVRPDGGIIPARAGFTSQPNPVGLTTKDHPRSRGVYARFLMLMVCILGSSPLARGLLRERVMPYGVPGIIPARAGFTTSKSSAARSRGDHPRSRGVYGPMKVVHEIVDGSSPLARGLPH